MKKIIISCILVLISGCGKTTNDNKLNDNIPTLTFSELEPLLKTSSDSVFLVNFWATWCEPCIEELPAFEAINQEFKDKKFKMLLVSLDFKKQKDKKLIPFVNENKLKAKVIHLNDPDANDWIEKVDSNWSGSIPATLIFTKHRREFFEQTFTIEQLRKTINNFN